MRTALVILFYCSFILLFSQQLFSQQSGEDEEENLNVSELEALSENDESESENDYDMQQLQQFRKHPIDLNGSGLENFTLLDPILISNLLNYRNLLGDLIDIHELQAIPGFAVEIIKKILPYVTVKKEKLTYTGMKNRLTKGEHSFLIRPVIIPEIQQGFRQSATSTERFTGSRPALLIRYKYQYRDLLQFGIVAEKDAGERLFIKGPLPDFSSFHFFSRQTGIIKAWAIGDYTINLGQGLIHWQSQAFRKSASVINVKRQSDILRPYHSAGEYNFHRGIAVILGNRTYEVTLFSSYKKLAAIINDRPDGRFITSFQTSGLHRTVAERENYNNTSLFTNGLNIKKLYRSGRIGFNAVLYNYSLPLDRKDEAYNLYTIKGRTWYNYSVDYSHTYRNFHFFGEAALDRNSRFAIINGVMASIAPTIDVSAIYRNIAKSYQSVYGNAFTENSMTVNEKGFYLGISMKPNTVWKFDLHADMFTFPWLKYRLDAPSVGFQYLFQVTFLPNRQTEFYTRYRYRNKPLNKDSGEKDFPYQIPCLQKIQNWRTQLGIRVNKNITIRSRVELCLIHNQLLPYPETGYLFFADLVYKPPVAWLTGNIRIQVFEATSYDTRIYAFENDVLFASSIPAYYNNGVRYYLNLAGKFRLKLLSNRLLTISLKGATTVYTNIATIGTSSSAVNGNRISSLKLQIFLRS